MATVHDVVKFILRRCAPVSAMKLQKLLYYSQAWQLAWEGKPLFRARIEAWANGPVIPEVYTHHRGSFTITEWPLGDYRNLTKDERETTDAVLNFYGDKSPLWLSELTHMEAPWKDARKGFRPGDRCGNEITRESMGRYYAELLRSRT